MFRLSENNQVDKIEPTTFADLKMTEKDVESLLKDNIEMISDEESLLVIGQQVRNSSSGICDLLAIDKEGNLVLIEIKRDKKDIESRKEAFEFQAIRYAASFATIKDQEDLVTKLYAPYIENNIKKHEIGELTTVEYASRKLQEFLEDNDSGGSINNKQRIVLIASDYDEQTLSAVAWLNNNGVDMTCYKIVPYKINEDVFIHTEKVLPLESYDDYYVNLLDKSKTSKSEKNIKRRSLPKIDKLIEWKLVQPGDILESKNKKSKGTLLKNGNIEVDGEEKSLQSWLKDVYGWSAVETYRFTIHKKTGKSLSNIRREYMEQNKDV